MSNQATLSDGTTLAYLNGGVFTVFAQIVDLTPPGQKVNRVDVTHLASPSGKEVKPGRREATDLSFDIQYLPAQEQTLQGLIGTPTTYKVNLPDTNAWILPSGSFIADYNPVEVKDNNALGAKVAVAVNGLPIFVKNV